LVEVGPQTNDNKSRVGGESGRARVEYLGGGEWQGLFRTKGGGGIKKKALGARMWGFVNATIV